MGHEISYRAWARGIYSRTAYADMRKAEDELESLEEQILALVCMPPPAPSEEHGQAEVAAELVARWRELKEEWRETHTRLVALRGIEEAMEEKTYHVDLCPYCMRQVGYEMEDGDVATVCPQCGRKVDSPVTAVVDSITEDM